MLVCVRVVLTWNRAVIVRLCPSRSLSTPLVLKKCRVSLVAALVFLVIVECRLVIRRVVMVWHYVVLILMARLTMVRVILTLRCLHRRWV